MVQGLFGSAQIKYVEKDCFRYGGINRSKPGHLSETPRRPSETPCHLRMNAAIPGRSGEKRNWDLLGSTQRKHRYGWHDSAKAQILPLKLK